MKIYALLLSLTLFSCGQVTAQVPVTQAIPGTVTLKHDYYTANFDTVKLYPAMVQWWDTKPMLTCPIRLKREGNKFTPDPLLPNYTNLDKNYVASGYDRGHNMDAFDNECFLSGLIQCFYFSNVVAQTPRLNRGDWKSLEEYTRHDVISNDSVCVWCGSIGASKKIGIVTVPTKCWKVLYTKRLNKYEAFVFNNDASAPIGIDGHRVSVDSVFKLTGIRIK
jgi:DNA/RNA endonuclease G (NUC1)